VKIAEAAVNTLSTAAVMILNKVEGLVLEEGVAVAYTLDFPDSFCALRRA
jgi:hypothetical protein